MPKNQTQNETQSDGHEPKKAHLSVLELTHLLEQGLPTLGPTKGKYPLDDEYQGQSAQKSIPIKNHKSTLCEEVDH